MNLDIHSTAAVIRLLSDADLIRLIAMPSDAERAGILRLLPDDALVRLLTVASDAERPAAAPTASSAAKPPAVPGASRARGVVAPAADVELVVTAVRQLVAGAVGGVVAGPVQRATILAQTSGADWIENGWTADRVVSALNTAIAHGHIVMTGKNRGARYQPAAGLPDAPAQEAALLAEADGPAPEVAP